MLTIDNVDDAEEMKLTDEAFDVLGFTRVCSEIEWIVICFFVGEMFIGRKIEYVQMYSGYYAFR